ncbi:hypothetical protein BW723_09280 [Polaribacter reichenbachii]|uniref:Uncharacterized protein n=1 Tax=Polaribacter reichenbachii TaxID=996801 RepID=A0A1B8U7E6_9FLAO|nr:hypothetical protein [Polaribacter reichenbachii]APZ46476.1 hypothetical protein BW723_09280 [Polaribacter reichenbachii]AUC20341.1 hypothetical protein BTO17_17315 [Polaribacter reichenbachii]OBY67757.1 hypothetical protein LPB301_00220 [Polaribacter reichenbachii]
MKKLVVRPKKILFTVSNLEKKHKIVTYFSLLFLTVSTYFLRTENKNVKGNYKVLKEKSTNLKQNMVLFNRNYEGFPLPVWQKLKRGNEFVMQYVNPEYVEKFGKAYDKDQYAFIGKNNFELFPEKLAEVYYKYDLEVSKNGKELECAEEAIDQFGNTLKLKVIKWRKIKDNNDTLIYGMVKEIIPFKNTN